MSLLQGGSQPTDAAEKTVRVDLGPRSYDILVGPGLLERAGDEIAGRHPDAAVAVVTDRNVADSHLPTLERALDTAGIRHSRILVEPGEATKAFGPLQTVLDGILAARLERNDLVVALGGGVVGDLAGFAAAIARRGMNFIQIPSSLLAQVDSSVGGKTGINSSHGKNLVGAFHQPSLVLADTEILSSLPLREFRAGYAEVVKYGLINDPRFFDWLCAHWRDVFDGGQARVDAVAHCCRAKAAIVAEDEYETGSRALLNLGHTFGHALEAATGYSDRLVHGEGVAIGMAMAFRFSERLGLCGGNAVGQVCGHLQDVGLPTSLAALSDCDVSADTLLTHIHQDKKVSRGALTFILATGIGAAFISQDVDPHAVRSFLEDEQTR
ncbi:MAG: 3-dehydroquinate synthase [Pseudomonadota bacterium]